MRAALVPAAVALAAAGAAAQPADTPPLLCLGTQPPFLLAVRPAGDGGGRATFDYLGDGTFEFRPMPRPGLPRTGYRLETAGGPLDVRLEARACPALGMSFPVTVRMAVPSAGGTVTYIGCCIWQDG
jgi:hypothetical protein